MQEDPRPKSRWRTRSLVVALLAAGAVVASAVMRYPETPLPPQWNVFEPLSVAAPATPITQWKLDWAASDPALCLQVLGQAAEVTPLDDREETNACGITGRVVLRGVGQAALGEVETACATALRLAMWERHDLQPLAQEIFGSSVARIAHIGSYNCRRISGSERMSTHARAAAIDVTGFTLTDGTKLRLLNDWTTQGKAAEFLRRARNGSCDWFGTTLGPDYNAAHADHFHLQNEGWGTCR